MTIYDVHTHHLDAIDAIISCNPWEFAPQAGKYYSVGIHPWYSDKVTDATINDLRTFAASEAVIAIGECGIDALRGATIEYQASLAQLHAELAESLKKPLILHCVRTGNYIINLHRRLHPRQPWIIHGFRGTSGLATSLLACQGIYLSFGERFNPQALEVTPVSRCLVETDESAMPIAEIAAKVAAAKHCTPQELSANRLFPNLK